MLQRPEQQSLLLEQASFFRPQSWGGGSWQPLKVEQSLSSQSVVPSESSSMPLSQISATGSEPQSSAQLSEFSAPKVQTPSPQQ
jgi:hypothetical protein